MEEEESQPPIVVNEQEDTQPVQEADVVMVMEAD